METGEEAAEIRRELVTQWGVRMPVVTAAEDEWTIVLAALRERVADLLARNPQKLLTALYILDISEKRYLQALDQPTQADRAHDLALAILERETEKIRTRRMYGGQNRMGDADGSG
jgi:hypothetical protein